MARLDLLVRPLVAAVLLTVGTTLGRAHWSVTHLRLLGCGLLGAMVPGLTRGRGLCDVRMSHRGAAVASRASAMPRLLARFAHSLSSPFRTAARSLRRLASSRSNACTIAIRSSMGAVG